MKVGRLTWRSAITIARLSGGCAHGLHLIVKKVLARTDEPVAGLHSAPTGVADLGRLAYLSMGGQINHSVTCGLMAIAIATTVPSCSRGDLSPQFAAALAASAIAENIKAEASGPLVTVAETQFRVVARIEHEERIRSEWVVGVYVTASTDSGSDFGAGTLGIGPSRTDAVENAATDWAQLTGLALIRGLALKALYADRVVSNGIAAYPGSIRIRGPAQPAWSKEHDARLLQLVLTTVPADGQPHLVSLMVAVDPIKEVTGECRLDATVSPAMLDAAKTFSWERLDTIYLFKQFYLVTPAQ